MAALQTTDLRKVMKRDPNFLGVFAIDKVPRTVDRKAGNVKLIINLDPSTKPGSHWVAIWRRNGKSFYFDSFGRLPPNILKHWMMQNSDSWSYNTIRMQSPKDKTACGYLCLSFLTKKFSL